MTIFNVISLFGGLALFLYGMTVMSSGLEHLSGGRLEATLEKLTGNIFKSILLGMLVTGAIQSSSATTVIVVGLVNAKVLKLRQAIGIIMGANIGTTITAHIIRMTDIDSTGNMILAFLKPSTLAPVAAIIGILLYFISQRTSKRDVGILLIGFSVLFTGMFAMEGAVKPLQSSPEFANLFASFSNPILGVLVGAVVTMIIQSSSASVGILQALTSTGVITFSSAFPIIMGQNIGTCITPVLASMNASRNAKRTACIHVAFNVIGTIFFLVVIYSIQYTVGFKFWNDSITKGGIANFHTIFNLTVTVLLVPFASMLEKLAYFIIKLSPDEERQSERDEAAKLDDRFLNSPSFAIQQARAAVMRMAELALENFDRSISLIHTFDKKVLDQAREVEDLIDRIQSRVDMYLIQLTKKELTETESLLLSEVLQVVNEFERIGDHDDNICDSAAEMAAKNVSFSDFGMAEFDIVSTAVREIMELAINGYKERDDSLAQTIEPLEEVINILVSTLKVRHNERLQQGVCNIDSAFPFVEMLHNLERIADHCSNVGVHIITYSSGTEKALDRHEYLREMHRSQTPEYKEKFDMYDRKYYDRIKSMD